MNIQIAEGILIPFLGTALGAAMVFFLKKQISDALQKALTGFAAGVMVAASFWSLLQPALDSSADMGSLPLAPRMRLWCRARALRAVSGAPRN